VLTEAIPLENAKGRFDHFAIGGGKLFVVALGSDAVEVINIGGRILEHTITGVPDPQGIAFSPEANKLFIASGRGKVYIYDSQSYNQIAAIDFREAPITSATTPEQNVST
jgi:DNA-binding beta-propeller fold protein YncE